ncbi:leukosialin-like [Salvelinus sp. IW2-2015]|uniref:leukosialin-like n=1 Tax=Salvelinus sp. IW2-2015 TaxID=2691554 RepID=UPI000CDFB483|nr:mucin-2-like [Salvelinus alpinus]XP_023854026.1 mucin-2-like [Salvelinus alpinus]XP_023854027.1 mucin-2-like [Salvelinus alpinus]
MERIRLMLGALLLSLSLPSLPAQDNVTVTVPENVTMAAPINEDVTMAASTPEATIETKPVPVLVTWAQPAPEIITPVTAIPKVTSVSVPTTDAITMVITNPEITIVQDSTSDAPTTTSEAETMTPSPVTTEGLIDMTTPTGPKPTLSQDVLTTASYLPTTSQDHLTSVIPVWPLTTPRLTEDSTYTPEPIHTASEITACHTEGLTTAPTSPSVNAAPGHATTPATTHTSTDPDSTSAGIRGKTGQPSLLWVIIVALLIVVIFAGVGYCVCLVIRRKRQSHTAHFVSSFRNGKSSKRKKGAEEDAWAGPVKLGGGDRKEDEGGEEGGSPEDNKREGAGTDVVLSTFIANETEGERGEPDGGVGVAGSKEAEKWEEKEPLLYIDEGVEEGQERMAPPSLSKSN